MGWYRAGGDGAVIAARVRPNARASAITGLVKTADGGKALGVRLAAKPVDGAANKALTDLIARSAGVPRSSVSLVAGQTSRIKRVQIAGAWTDLEPRLAALAEKKG